MLDSIFLRLTVLVVAIVLVATVWSSLRRRLPRAHRFLTDYTLAMYGLTYAAGCCVLYLFRYDYLFRFYGNAVFFPTFTSFELVLFLGLLPFLVLPIMVAGILALTRGAVTHLPEDPIGTEAKTIGLALVLLPSLALIAPIAGQLMSNALGDLLSTSSATSLYTQRALVFEQVSFLQGGVIYSVLPAVAAILLFWQGQHPWMSRVLGAGIALIATLLNLGMFQIGPTLSFFLTCTFCYIVLRGGRISLPVAGGALFLGSVVLGFYSLLKTSANNINQIEIFLMRLPMRFLISSSSPRRSQRSTAATRACRLTWASICFPNFDPRSASSRCRNRRSSTPGSASTTYRDRSITIRGVRVAQEAVGLPRPAEACRPPARRRRQYPPLAAR
ncbi:hypothetical protein [Sphingomonas melonis]|uniref:hypothetical protein n=1 Tax=Sphingomonas melonis TaxID=152682 RepID=UPI0008710D33|nr:hypothetical protein [Sphingomonas melonis]AOW24481.1 hypothetical protein BJP26_13585 [Sphingomonas melonis TY]